MLTLIRGFLRRKLSAAAEPLIRSSARERPCPETHRYCAFCARSNEEVALLIKALAEEVFICNHCVELCSDIVQKEKDKCGSTSMQLENVSMEDQGAAGGTMKND
ncbi:MAG TPA: ClpX C4-type zinc finger protein [Steroidobacteraceae bacterium]